MDTVASSSFKPPFCPRPRCRFHLDPQGWRWVRYGFYTRQCLPRTIPRFRCRHCGSTFSSQSFSTTYYLKRPALLAPIFYRLLSCAGYRQIAREARCHPTTVMGQATRLGRHALLFLHEYRPRGPIREPLVIDGFESFAYSQYHPLHLNCAVGAESHFVYALTLTELRRKGRMTAEQKRRRAFLEARHGRPDPKALELDIAELIRLAAPGDDAITIRSDEHPAYPRALRRLRPRVIHHECTPSVEARTARNPLFPVNLLDLLLRHNSANHKRETISFSKTHQSALERAALVQVWRNFVKPFSENHGGGTPAMRIGRMDRPLTVQEILRWRLFSGRVALPRTLARYYQRQIPTRRIPHTRRYELKLAG